MANSAVLRGPQLRNVRHFLSSPTVTKVMHIVCPARAARNRSGRRFRRLADATSVSRTMRLTACWRDGRHRGLRGTHPALRRTPTHRETPVHQPRQSAVCPAGEPGLRLEYEVPRAMAARARHCWTSLAAQGDKIRVAVA